jgi:hypothetical protein
MRFDVLFANVEDSSRASRGMTDAAVDSSMRRVDAAAPRQRRVENRHAATTGAHDLHQFKTTPPFPAAP